MLNEDSSFSPWNYGPWWQLRDWPRPEWIDTFDRKTIEGKSWFVIFKANNVRFKKAFSSKSKKWELKKMGYVGEFTNWYIPEIEIPLSVCRLTKKHNTLYTVTSSKGQIILECPYKIIVHSKIATKKFPRFLPWPLRRGQTKNFIKPIMLNNP